MKRNLPILTVTLAWILSVCLPLTPAAAMEMWIEPSSTSETASGWALSGSSACFSFAVPDNFQTFSGAKVIVLGRNSRHQAVTYDITLRISKQGKSPEYRSATKSGLSDDVNNGKNLFREIDISEVTSDLILRTGQKSLEPGVSLVNLSFKQATPDPETSEAVRVLGLRFIYDGVFALKGTWKNAKTYKPEDIVSFNGSSYVCRNSNTGTEPDTSSSDWTLLAASGKTGPAGPTGPTGASGIGTYQRVFDYFDTTLGPGGTVGLSLSCPGSTYVLGGGAMAWPAEWAVNATYPMNDNTWAVWFHSTAQADSAPVTGKIAIYAVCSTVAPQ